MASRQYAFKGFVGLGFESPSAYGTPVARTAFSRFLEANIDKSHGQDMPETSRLRAAEDAVLGDYDVKVNGRAELRPETIGAWLKALAGNGSVATTTPGGATTTRRHTITPQDTRQPVTLERRMGTLAFAEVVQGSVLSEIQLECVRGMWAFGYRGVGQKDVNNATPTTPSFDAKVPWRKHHAAVTLGGTAYGVRNARVKLARQITEDDFETGSRYRVDADIGASMAETEFDLYVRDAALIKRSLGLANATQPQDDPLYNADSLVLTGAVIEGSFNYKLTVTLPRVFWEPIGVPMRGKEGLVQRVRGTVLYDEASSFEWQAVLDNTQTSL